MQYLPTDTFSILGEGNSFLKTDGVGPCVVLHFYNKEKGIVGMAHVAHSDVLIDQNKGDILTLDSEKTRNYIQEFITNVETKNKMKISDFNITIIDNKPYHSVFLYNDEKIKVGVDLMNVINECLQAKNCNVVHRNVDYGRKYVSIVTNKEGGVEVYPVKNMNMELVNSLKSKNAEEFKQMQQNYKMRYEDLVQDDSSPYLNMLRHFQQNFQETKKLGAHYAPPEICSRVKKNKDGTNMNIGDYRTKPINPQGRNSML